MNSLFLVILTNLKSTLIDFQLKTLGKASQIGLLENYYVKVSRKLKLSISLTLKRVHSLFTEVFSDLPGDRRLPFFHAL